MFREFVSERDQVAHHECISGQSDPPLDVADRFAVLGAPPAHSLQRQLGRLGLLVCVFQPIVDGISG